MTVEVFERQHERSEKVTDISEWFFGGEKELVGFTVFTRATTAARQMCEDKIDTRRNRALNDDRITPYRVVIAHVIS